MVGWHHPLNGHKFSKLQEVGDGQGGLGCLASLVAQTVKRLPAMQDPGFDSWVGKIPWRRIWQSTPALLPGKSHGQRSLIGYSPWGRKESDTTEQLHFHFLSQVRKTIHKGIQ